MTDAAAPCNKDDFHRERSRFLDAFAILEETMVGKTLPATDKKAADLFKALKVVRNDLVHSQLRFAQIDGKLHAIAINSQESGKPARASRVIALDDFKSLKSEIGKVRKALG